MHKLKKQNGYILMFSIFFLACTLLCTSVLVLTLSDRHAASNETVQKEQSRFLAYSGWNLALEQLQLYGNTNKIERTTPAGKIQVAFEANTTQPAAWKIYAEGQSGSYHRNASGVIQCFPFPFADTTDWNVTDAIYAQREPAILLLNTVRYTLTEDCMYPLGITYVGGEPMCVEIANEIYTDSLYIYGDLVVLEDALLTAERIYVSGNISGAEQINCNAMYSGYADGLPYQIRVLERNVT